MRFRLRTLFIVLFAFSLAFAGVAAYWHNFGGRRYYNRRIEAHLRQLDAKRPSTLTVAQWECLARSTRTLHSNSLISFETSLADISDFEKRLDERISGPADEEVIEWIWDEYAKICEGGRRYQRFRVLFNDELKWLESPVLLETPQDEPKSTAEEETPR